MGAAVDPARIGQRVLVDPSVRDPQLPKRAQLAEYLGSERDGGFADYVAVPSINAHVIDSPLSDAELATFPCSYDTAEEMLARADLGEGETILITGAAGGVGTALIQLARVRGARVVAVASESKGERLEVIGRRLLRGTRRSQPPRGPWRLSSASRPSTSSPTSSAASCSASSLKVLRRAGRYTTSGAIGGPTTAIDLRDLIYKDLEMHGITNPTAETFARLVALIEAAGSSRCSRRRTASRSCRRRRGRWSSAPMSGKFVVVP